MKGYNWINPLYLVTICLLDLTDAQERYVFITDFEGVINSPTFEECNLEVDDAPYSFTWEFPVTYGKMLYLNLTEFKLSNCDDATLIVKSLREVDVYCEERAPIDYYQFKTTKVIFESLSKMCSGNAKFTYKRYGLHTDVITSTPAKIHEKVVMQIDSYSIKDLRHLHVTCSVTFYEGSVDVLYVDGYANSTYVKPGRYKYTSTCDSQAWSGRLLKFGYIEVEAVITLQYLNLTYDTATAVYGTDITLLFKHTYAYPIYYILLIEETIVLNRNNLFNDHKFTHKLPEVVNFLIGENEQMKLGPGEHSFVLILQNNVSSVSFSSSFTLTEVIRGFSISTQQFVSTYPYKFIINSTFTHGAPANISLNVRKQPTNILEVALTTYCMRSCSIVQFKTSTVKGNYRIDAIAYNDVSSETAVWGDFEAIPQVHDVHITSPDVAIAGSETDVYIFICSDIGEFDLIIDHEEQRRTLVFKNEHHTYQHDHVINVPFDPQHYKLVVEKFRFKSARSKTIRAVINNSKQSFNFSGNILVLDKPSCLESVKIRDGQKGGGIGKPLKVARPIILTADTKFTCVEDSNVRFEWKAFELESEQELPKRRVDFSEVVNQAQVKVQPSTFPPGLYVIAIMVTTHDVTTDDVIWKAEDFTLIEVQTRKLEFVIIGGSKREIGSNIANVEFESSLFEREGLSYDWYCAVTMDDLPRDPQIGKATRKGSCFGWTPLWMTSDKVASISTSELTPGRSYFVRLIVTGPGFEPGYSDQKIFLLPHQAPIMELKCWSNCGKLLSPQLPIILQLQCDDCLRHRWMVDNLELESCHNKEFCKITPDFFDNNLQTNITAIGFDENGNNASVSMTSQHVSVPYNGECIMTPESGTAYVTKFSVTCNGYIDDNQPLSYEFFLKDKAKQNPLLQYGYDSELKEVLLSPAISDSDVTIMIEICNSVGACVFEEVSAYVTRNNAQNSNIIKEIDVILKSHNLQKLTQVLSILPTSLTLNEATVNDVIDEVGKVNLISMTTAKEAADLLNLVTKGTGKINEDKQELVLAKISEIGDYIKNNDDANADNVLSTVTSCISGATNLMQMSESVTSKRDETSVISELGRLSMTSLLPGDSPMTFKTSSLEAKLLRISRNSSDSIARLQSEVNIPGLQTVLSDDVINIEIFKYNASVINFSTTKRKVSDVTAVSITTGWRNYASISFREAENLPTKYSVSPNNEHDSRFVLSVKSDCDVSVCKSTAVGSTLFETRFGEEENLKGAFLRINLEFGEFDDDVTQLSVHLKAEKKQNFDLKKKFQTAVKYYKWSIPATSLPRGGAIYNVSVIAQLGSGYYKKGSVFEIKLMTYFISCLYWDDVINDWNDVGCKPITNASFSSLGCECGRFPKSPQLGRRADGEYPTLLASRLLVYPNKIDFDKLSWNLWEKFLENPIIFIILIVLYSLYFLMVKWARKKDKDLEHQGYFIEVLDNSPYEKYRYYVTIYTGSRRSAGTTSTVSMKIVGSEKMSRVHLIQTSDRIVLKRDSVNSFLVTSSGSLGNITAVRLWHNNAGRSPEWYLQRMVVRDLESNECWFFICNQWFDHVTDHVFAVAGTRQLHTFNSLFKIKWENYVKDRHLWYSMYGMQPWQHREMTRVERVSSCLLLLFMIMLTSLMFYGREVAQPGFKINLGYYSFQWSQIAVGMESATLCFPMTYLVTTLFRLSQKRRERRRDFSDLQRLERGESIFPYDETIKKRRHDKSRARQPDDVTKPPRDKISEEHKHRKREHRSKHKHERRKSQDKPEAGHDKKKKKEKRKPEGEKSFPRVAGSKLSLKQKRHHRRHHKRHKRTQRGESEKVASKSPNRLKPSTRTLNSPTTSLSCSFYSLGNLNGSLVADSTVTSQVMNAQLLINSLRVSPYSEWKNLSTTTSCVSVAGSDVTNSLCDVTINNSSAEVEQSFNILPSARSAYHSGQIYDSKGAGSKLGALTIVDVDPDSVEFQPLPWFFTYIAWLIVFWTVIGSTILCVMYGMTYGVETCKEWLMSLFAGFLESVILLEPIKATLLAYVTVLNNPRHDLRDWIPPLCGKVVPRRHLDPESEQERQDEERRSNPAYLPPPRDAARIEEEARARERRIRRRIKTVSVHVVYLTLLLVASFGQREKSSFHFGRTLGNMLLEDFNRISSRADIYAWMDTSLADVFSDGHVRYFTDEQLLIVSEPRLRQKRVVQGAICPHSATVKGMKLAETTECKLQFDFPFQDKRNYGPGWSKRHRDVKNPYYDVTMSPWKYTKDNTSRMSDYYGEHGKYDGDGYYVIIPHRRSETRDLAAYLKRSGWVDDYTRLVVFEVVLYNVVHRVFCVVSLGIEIPNTGSVFMTSQMMFMKTHHVEYAWDIVVYCALFGILAMVFYHLVEIASSLQEQGFHFFYNLWNILHFCTLLLSTAAVALYLTRASYTDQALRAHSTRIPSFNLFHASAHIDYVTRCLLSSCVFFTMLHTVRIMEGHPVFELMHATLQRARNDLAGHSLYMFFVYCAFCHVGLLLFPKTRDFSSSIRTMQSVFGYAMEAFTSSDLLEHYPLIGWFYLLVFVVIFTKCFVNFYAVILENSFRETKLLRRDLFKKENVLSFGRKQLRSMFAIKDQKLKEIKNEEERKEYLKLLEGK